jgi:fructose-bisphosphate aldolase class I
MRDEKQLRDIATKMVVKGKGILAADESTPTCSKRFDSISIDSTYENRNEYRNMLFTADNLEEYISGVILFDETFRQSTTCDDKIPFVEYLTSKGIIPGIKVDKGAKPLAGSSKETITEGVDGLRERLNEYYDLGARFTKWRAVFNISEKYPSVQSIKSNAHALARYAALVQEAKMVPIVEPEVLMDGSHNIEKCYQTTTNVHYNIH